MSVVRSLKFLMPFKLHRELLSRRKLNQFYLAWKVNTNLLPRRVGQERFAKIVKQYTMVAFKLKRLMKSAKRNSEIIQHCVLFETVRTKQT